MRLGILDALFQDLLRLFDELTVQIDRVGLHSSIGVVFPENKLGCLPVIFLHLATVSLTLLGELLGAGSVAIRVRLLRLSGVSLVRFPSNCNRDCDQEYLKYRIPVQNIVRAWKLPGARGRGAGRTPPRRRCCCRG